MPEKQRELMTDIVTWLAFTLQVWSVLPPWKFTSRRRSGSVRSETELNLLFYKRKTVRTRRYDDQSL